MLLYSTTIPLAPTVPEVLPSNAKSATYVDANPLGIVTLLHVLYAAASATCAIVPVLEPDIVVTRALKISTTTGLPDVDHAVAKLASVVLPIVKIL